MAHLPLMLHANPQIVGCLGLATGITAGAALEHKSVDSLQIAELAPLVFRAADVYFKPFNHAVTTDSRSNVVIEDARIFAAANPNKFDVVIGDLFLPWAPGEARLYTVEHFHSVHQSLKPGGLFCQWLAAYQLNAEQIDIIQSTFCEVFPEAHLFRYNFDDLNPALAIVGYRNPEQTLDWQAITDRCNRSRMSNEATDPLMRHVEGLAMLYLGSIKVQEFGERKNRLSNMMLELSASEVQVSDDRGYFSGDEWFKFVTRRQPKIVLPESTRELPQVGNELTIVQVGLRELPTLNTAQVNHLNRMIEDLKAKLPATIRNDKDADWDKWPGEKQLIIK
jgi:spermidine synthase